MAADPAAFHGTTVGLLGGESDRWIVRTRSSVCLSTMRDPQGGDHCLFLFQPSRHRFVNNERNALMLQSLSAFVFIVTLDLIDDLHSKIYL